ncbi:hypothetical protein ACFFF1_09835 [Listeria seeligeri]|uniref:hypothetical protein n=1 Tax=Listeria seeligeri TaxID=1640 RepID=UPI0001C4EB2D|nr:hypothetical protein [Listeria seeligeri]MBC1723449.1 hypothetical protein [Listeria seeligeri]MBF2436481.1 hypothetical protein [Listeria seeligeri]CBH28200.1 hypothetical protein lse_2049 [Listeria seeligeri serovar 1/2b str. SLCC3954]
MLSVDKYTNKNNHLLFVAMDVYNEFKRKNKIIDGKLQLNDIELIFLNPDFILKYDLGLLQKSVEFLFLINLIDFREKG